MIDLNIDFEVLVVGINNHLNLYYLFVVEMYNFEINQQFEYLPGRWN
jgi:hypothetical protein